MIRNWLSTFVPEPGAHRRLGLATGIYNIGTGMFFTVSVLYFTEGLGLSVTEVGLWLAVAGLIGLCPVFRWGTSPTAADPGRSRH